MKDLIKNVKKVPGPKLKNSGITLIALVVTIIVLLILAGISIQMLTGDNGILKKAGEAKEDTERSQIIETAQMDILRKTMEKNGEGLTEDELETILIKYGTLLDEDKDNILDKTLTTKENYEIAVSEIYNGKIRQDSDFIIYPNGKDSSSVSVNDDIIIGTEKFLVIKKTYTTIVAIPYYDITLTDNPIQSSDAEEITFSSSEYWGYDSEVDMKDSRNNIYPYITAYANTLKKYGAKNIKVRTPLKNDIIDLSLNQRNPSKSRGYWINWIGTNKLVYNIGSSGELYEDFSWASSLHTGVDRGNWGVRPVIEIPTGIKGPDVVKLLYTDNYNSEGEIIGNSNSITSLDEVKTVQIAGASKLKVIIKHGFCGTLRAIRTETRKWDSLWDTSNNEGGTEEFEIDGDTLYLYFWGPLGGNDSYSGYYAIIKGYDSDGNFISEE